MSNMSSIIPITCPQEEEVVKGSKYVHIDQDGVNKLASEVIEDVIKESIKDKGLQVKKKFERHKYFPERLERTSADWIFLINTLNFSLFASNSPKKWTVNGEEGYSALCYAIKRAIKEHCIPLYDPYYYARLSKRDIKKIFIGDERTTCIPFLEKRVKILRDVGNTLINKFNGTFRTCLRKCGFDSNLLMDLLTNEFAYYRDEVDYYGKKVCLNTKAKILINDLAAYYDYIIKFQTCEMCKKTSTIFADRRFLQVFNYFNVLRYDEEFRRRLVDQCRVTDPDIEELEIRSCSIVAIKKVCEEVQKMLVNSTKDEIGDVTRLNIRTVVDNFLFSFADSHSSLASSFTNYDIPFYNIRTVFY